MWDKDTSRKIAHILNLIEDPPNLRPKDGTTKQFDGGEMTVYTGIVRFNFADGSTALYGTGLNIGLTITFPSGEIVEISSSNQYCPRCQAHISGEAAQCPACALER